MSIFTCMENYGIAPSPSPSPVQMEREYGRDNIRGDAWARKRRKNTF